MNSFLRFSLWAAKVNLTRRGLLALMVVAFVLTLLACAKNDVAGTGTETSTKGIVIGRILKSDGSPGNSSVVELLPDTYDPMQDSDHGLVLRDTTDANGEYRFKVRNPGRYSLQAKQTVSNLRAFTSDIRSNDDSTQVTATILLKPGSIRVTLPDTGLTGGGYCYIPGTTVLASVGKGESAIVLDSVPAGIIPSVRYAATDAASRRILRYDISVAPGENVSLRRSEWQHSRKLVLNTTAKGADVTGMVLAFPVLVRLTADNFIFSQAMPHGEDIRFEKAGGESLSQEIESWDSQLNKASMWVKLDTVYGNNATQAITLYWGNSNATDISNGTAVFDTSLASGFQGVWHMNQVGGVMVQDATANHYTGTSTGMNSASSIEGPSGNGYAFNGLTSAIVVDVRDTVNNRLNFSTNSEYSISAWVNADSSNTESGTVWDKGYNDPTEFYLRLANNKSFNFTVTQPSGYNERTAPALLHTWTQIVAVKQAAKQMLYVNGVLVDSTGIFLANTQTTSHGGTLVIGRSAITTKTFNFFRGSIDEVTVANLARSPDWIKLAFQNQKQNDLLVEIP